MCGFFVIYSKKNNNINKNLFLKSGNLIKHRGPDDSSTYFDNKISILFHRLSIRDLSIKGRQPMHSDSRRFIIVFNGEIYNSLELKKKYNLKNLKGQSDTEVLLKLYEKYGRKILPELNGMFSFLIYDRSNKTCFIARDRYGIKPIFYSENEKNIIFSSEIKPILNYLNKIKFNFDSFGNFFLKGYMDHDDSTFFKGINTILPASFKIFKKGKSLFKRYWHLSEVANIRKYNDIETVQKKLKFLFDKSIKNHLISDIDVGSCLSGGNDSSSISSNCKNFINYKLKTFTYEFKKQTIYKDSETQLASRFAKKKNFENFQAIVDEEYVLNNFDKLICEIESPMTSLRLFGIRKLYEVVKSQNIKVILEGHGGDDVLAGYDYNFLPSILDKSQKKNIVSQIFNEKNIKRFGIKKLINFIYCLKSQGNFTSDGTPYLIFNLYNDDFVNNFLLKDQIKQECNNFNHLQYSQFLEISKIHLPRVLKYVDRLSMISGVEARVPFLDNNLFSYCFSLDNNLKIKNFKHRWIWKKTFKSLGVSENKKKTITDPQKNWFKTTLRELFEDEINSSFVRNSDFFNQENIIKYFENYKKGNFTSSFILMQILSSIKFMKLFQKKTFIN
tara:strand:+ start:327 stop:2171 length:1845 start_codon:yes stop_codon:yes gene_type:complete